MWSWQPVYSLPRLEPEVGWSLKHLWNCAKKRFQRDRIETKGWKKGSREGKEITEMERRRRGGGGGERGSVCW